MRPMHWLAPFAMRMAGKVWVHFRQQGIAFVADD
jgi:hypothetical protein